MISTVKEWIDNGCDYNEGVALFAMLSPKSKLNEFFKGDARFKDRPAKLKHELLKIQPVKLTMVKAQKQEKAKPPIVKVVPVVVNDAPAKETAPEKPTADTSKPYPEKVQKAIDLLSSLYKEKAKLWNERAEMGWNNSAELVSKRKELSDKILDITNQMDYLYEVRNNFDKTGTIPDDDVALKVEASKTEELPNSIEELRNLKKNLQTNNSKDRNLLDYQSKQAKGRKTPMPDGPNKVKIQERIAEREKRIEEINSKIKLLNAGKA